MCVILHCAKYQHAIDMHDIPVYYKQIVVYCCCGCCYLPINDSNGIPFCCIVSNLAEPYRILISIQITVDMEHNNNNHYDNKEDGLFGLTVDDVPNRGRILNISLNQLIAHLRLLPKRMISTRFTILQ